MVVCAIVGCNKRSGRDNVSLYRIPYVDMKRNCKYYDLIVKRQMLWILRIRRKGLAQTKIQYTRVCSLHFISGKPSSLYDVENPDWAPCVNLGYEDAKITATVKRYLKRLHCQKTKISSTASSSTQRSDGDGEIVQSEGSNDDGEIIQSEGSDDGEIVQSERSDGEIIQSEGSDGEIVQFEESDDDCEIVQSEGSDDGEIVQSEGSGDDCEIVQSKESDDGEIAQSEGSDDDCEIVQSEGSDVGEIVHSKGSDTTDLVPSLLSTSQDKTGDDGEIVDSEGSDIFSIHDLDPSIPSTSRGKIDAATLTDLTMNKISQLENIAQAYMMSLQSDYYALKNKKVQYTL